MARLRAVVEIGPEGVEGAAWPIETATDYRLEPLDASTPPLIIATVLADAAEYCRPEEVDPDHRPSPVEALHWIAEADYLVIRAGIQATDNETTIKPGCCADLEGWRGWPDMWLGHDPSPVVERIGGSLLIHQEKGSQNVVKLPAAALPALLNELRQDLTAFLTATEHWATTAGADQHLAAAMAATIDRHVGITAPLA